MIRSHDSHITHNTLKMYGLRFEDARFLGEGVDALTSFGRGAALHGETSEAGNNELTTLPTNEQMIKYILA